MWYTATSASVTNGSDVVTITNGDDISIVQENSGLVFEGSSPVEVIKAYIDIGGNKVIQLARPWPYSTKTNQPLVAYPTDADFAAATAELRRVIDTLTIANTAEAQLGEDDEKIMTPLKVKAAIDFRLDQRLEDIDDAWVMRKVEFEAHRAANNEKFAASGFVHFGKQFIDRYQKKIGEGLYTLRDISNSISLGRNDTLGLGDSKTTASVINVSGVITELNHKGSGRAVDIKFPPAEYGKRTYDSSTGISVTHATPAIAFASETDTNKVVTDRVDMWGFEAFLREINDTDPFVYDKGLIQSQASIINDVATVSDNVRPITYFAWYEGDESSRGKGVNWQTASEATRIKIASDPANNIYFDDATGKFYQWCILGRSFAGVGNGEWDNIDAISGDLQFDSFNKITPTMTGSTKFSAGENIGVFTADNNSHCHLLVCGTVNRLNQGAYHPSFNSSGSKADANGANWAISESRFINKEACFDTAKVSTTVSGRPDNRLSNYIYASGQGGVCRDMRYSAWGLTQEDFAVGDLAVKSGKYRGREKLVKSYIRQNTYKYSNFASRRYTFDITDLALPDLPLGYASSGSNNGYILGKQGELFPILSIGINSSEISIVTTPAGYSEYRGEPESLIPVVLEIPFYTEVAGEYTHTEVTGDFANILQCAALKEGWVGSWNPTEFTGSNIHHPFTRLLVSNAPVASTYTSDNGNSWALNNNVPSVNQNLNGRATGASSDSILIYQYPTKAKLTTNSESTSFINVGDVTFSGSSTECRDLGFSLTGGIGKSTTSPSLNLGLTQVGINLDSGELSASKETRHTPISSESPTNDSPAFKVLNYNVVENQQGFINYAYTELKHNGTDWGDDGEIHIANNQATRTDDNGNAVVYGTARIAESLGWIKNDK